MTRRARRALYWLADSRYPTRKLDRAVLRAGLKQRGRDNGDGGNSGRV